MTLTLLIILYVICALLTGLVGRYRRMGFLGTFLLSLVITPLLMLLILALTGPSQGIEWRPRDE